MNQKQKALWELFILYWVAIVGAALLAPGIYSLVNYLALSHPHKWLSYLARHSLEAYFERIRHLAMLLPIPWLLRRWSLKSWSTLGLEWSFRAARDYLRGIGIGLAIVGSLIMALNTLGNVTFRDLSATMITQFIGVALVSGMLIGFLEESIFRGIVLGLLRGCFSSIYAIIFCSLFFAYTHFKAESHTVITHLAFDSGFRVAYETVTDICRHFDALYFFTLFLLSALLCLMTFYKKGLAQAIGVHWGIVWGLLATRKILIIEKPLHGSIWWGKGAFQSSPVVLVLLIILNAIYLWFFFRGKHFEIKREAQNTL